VGFDDERSRGVAWLLLFSGPLAADDRRLTAPARMIDIVLHRGYDIVFIDNSIRAATQTKE
jgi:hypothetical protein